MCCTFLTEHRQWAERYLLRELLCMVAVSCVMAAGVSEVGAKQAEQPAEIFRAVGDHKAAAVMEKEAPVYDKASSDTQNCRQLGTLKYGGHAKVGAASEHWYEIRYKGEKAYIRQNGTVLYNYRKKHIALTFDDGPSELTEPLLDMLDQCGVKATFFDVGIRIEKYPDLAAETVSRGHAVGLHSYDHDYGNVYSSLESFADSTFKAQAALQSATGVTSYLYRFPGGSSNLVHQKFGTLSMTACADWLTQNGFTYDDWNVSSGDANETPYTADEIADMVIDGVGDMNTAVVLMHNIEGKESTIEALPKIVETLTAKGYTFGTLQAGGVTVHHHAAD